MRKSFRAARSQEEKGRPEDALFACHALSVIADIGIARQTGVTRTLLQVLGLWLGHRASEADEVCGTAVRTEDLDVKTVEARIDAIRFGLRLRLMIVGPGDDVPT